MSAWTLKANKGGDGGSREKVPAGNHPAVLVALIDLGEQHQEYQGVAKWQHQVYLVFEFPTKKDTTGKTFLLTEAVTYSLNERAKLRKWAQGISGKVIPDGTDFYIDQLLGKPCLVSVLHSEKGYPRIEGVTGYPDGLPAPNATRPPFALTLDEFNLGKSIPEWVPWMWSRSLEKMASVEECIRTCKELGGAGSAPSGAPSPSAGEKKDDVIPF